MNFSTNEGEVVGYRQETRSIVSGYGGGSAGGTISPVSISTHHQTATNFFVRSEDGIETSYCLNGDFPLRDGHKVKVLTAGDTVVAYNNYNTMQHHCVSSAASGLAGKPVTRYSVVMRVLLVMFMPIIFIICGMVLLIWPLVLFTGSEPSFGVAPVLLGLVGLSEIVAIWLPSSRNRRHATWKSRVDAIQAEIDNAIATHLTKAQQIDAGTRK